MRIGVNIGIPGLNTIGGGRLSTGATLDLAFAGTSGDLLGASTLIDDTLDLIFSSESYLIAPQYAVLGSAGMEEKTFSQVVTFTRSSSATYFDSAGALQTATTDVPRFDYDPATLVARGLLIEEQRTNLLLNSASLSTQSVTVSAVAYTLSFYGTGTVTLSGASTAGPLVGSGAFPTRSTLTFTPTAGTLTLTVTGTVQYAQLEAGSFATSYISTTGAAETRSADLALVNTLSPWFNLNEGVLYVQATWPVSAASGILIRAGAALSDGTTNNRVIVGRGSAADNARGQVASGGVIQNGTGGQSVAGVFASSNTAKLALSYATDNITFATNGSVSSATPPSSVPLGIDRLSIGNRYDTNAGSSINGWVQRIVYYPRVLSSAELQTMTT